MPVAKMAVQFNNGTRDTPAEELSDWYPTGKAAPQTRLRYYAGTFDGTSHNPLIPATAWGEVRRVKYGVDREYGGINSSGGPQHSGRPEHRLIWVERESDQISPHLFKRCCNGMQLRRVVIWDESYLSANGNDSGVIIYAEDCHVVNFEATIFKNSAQQHTIDTANDAFTGITKASSQSYGSTTRADIITILYTKISLKVLGVGPQGWNTGNETAFDETLGF